MIAARQENLVALQLRVIAALVLRETRASFGNSSFGYLWAIITPAAGVGVLVFIFSLAGRHPPFGSSLALFFATGILTLEFFNRLSNNLMGAFDANRALFSYPVIKETDALYARLILVAATYFLIMVLFYGALITFGLADFPAHPALLPLAFGLTAALGFGFGTLNAVIASIWDSWTQIERILTRPLFFLSGIFYIPSHLPTEAIRILEWNPVMHLVELTREGYYPNYHSSVLQVSYPAGVALVLIFLGLAGERFLRRQRERS